MGKNKSITKQELVKTVSENQIAKIETPIEFSNAFSPEACMEKFAEVNSIEKAITRQTYSLVSMKKMFDKEIVIEYIKLWIIDLNLFLDMKRPMTTDQIHQTARIIFNSYYTLNLADIHLIFLRIKRGEFGNLYESINGTKLISFFEQYFSERTQLCYDKSYEEHDKVKYQERREGDLRAKIEAAKQNEKYEQRRKKYGK